MEGIIRDAVLSNNKSVKEQKKPEKYSKINPRLSIDDAFTDRSYSFRVNWMKDEKLLNQLKKDNIDIELFQCQIKNETNETNNKTIKSRLLLFLQSNPIQIIIALLVLVDAGIVIAEIILEIHSLKNSIEAHQEQMRETIDFMNRTFHLNLNPTSHSNPHDEINSMESILETLKNYSHNCTAFDKAKGNSIDIHKAVLQPPAAKPHLRYKRGGGYRKKSSSLDNTHGNSNKSSLSANHRVSEKKHRSQTLHVVSETLHYASIIILGLFVLEVGLKISCVGMKFFKAKFEVVDAVVIVTSFVADIIIVNVGSQEISVMIIFLLWRIVRVINGLLMHEKQRDEFRIALQKKARRVSEMKVDQLTIQNEMQEKHIMALEDISREAGISELLIKRCRPKYIQYTKDQTNNPLKSIAAMTTGFMGGLVGAQPSNKEINRFAASYSPSCTPRNRSPLSQKRLKVTTPSQTASVNFNFSNNNTKPNHKNLTINNVNKPSILTNSLQKTCKQPPVYLTDTWGSSINSVFDNDSQDDISDNNNSYSTNQMKLQKKKNLMSLTDDDDENLSLNLINPVKSDNSSNHSPVADYTSNEIASPYIEDNMVESLDSASLTCNANVDDETVIFRCFHNKHSCSNNSDDDNAVNSSNITLIGNVEPTNSIKLDNLKIVEFNSKNFDYV